jgi:hypothetical protein
MKGHTLFRCLELWRYLPVCISLTDAVTQFVVRSADCFVPLAAVVECADRTSVLVHTGKLAVGFGQDAGLSLEWLRHLKRIRELSRWLVLRKKSDWH